MNNLIKIVFVIVIATLSFAIGSRAGNQLRAEQVLRNQTQIEVMKQQMIAVAQIGEATGCIKGVAEVITDYEARTGQGVSQEVEVQAVQFCMSFRPQQGDNQ